MLPPMSLVHTVPKNVSELLAVFGPRMPASCWRAPPTALGGDRDPPDRSAVTTSLQPSSCSLLSTRSDDSVRHLHKSRRSSARPPRPHVVSPTAFSHTSPVNTTAFDEHRPAGEGVVRPLARARACNARVHVAPERSHTPASGRAPTHTRALLRFRKL